MTDAVGRAILTAAETALTDRFGNRVVAIYALGSLAHGGFSAFVSDIDVGLIIESPLQDTDASCVSRASELVRAAGLPLADRLSTFWGTVDSINFGRGGRFPPLDRLDLIEHGKLLRGTEVRHLLFRPAQGELIIEGARFALDFLRTDENLKYMVDPTSLIAAGARKLTKLVLFPVRFLHTLRTGQIGENEAAVQHYLTFANKGKAQLASAGFLWRTTPPATTDDTALILLKDNLVPLYLEFIAEYYRKLLDLGEKELADRLSAWRDELCSVPENNRLEPTTE